MVKHIRRNRSTVLLLGGLGLNGLVEFADVFGNVLMRTGRETGRLGNAIAEENSCLFGRQGLGVDGFPNGFHERK